MCEHLTLSRSLSPAIPQRKLILAACIHNLIISVSAQSSWRSEHRWTGILRALPWFTSLFSTKPAAMLMDVPNCLSIYRYPLPSLVNKPQDTCTRSLGAVTHTQVGGCKLVLFGKSLHCVLKITI